MKVFIVCSKQCYGEIQSIVNRLKLLGHEVSFPNCFNNPNEENDHMQDDDTHRQWKAEMFRSSVNHIQDNDAVLVINLDIPGRVDGYIGGATMLEMYEAFRQNKKVFVYNELPECSYRDELNGLVTKIIYGKLSLMD